MTDCGAGISLKRLQIGVWFFVFILHVASLRIICSADNQHRIHSRSVPRNPLYYANVDINEWIKESLPDVLHSQNERFMKGDNLNLCGIHFVEQSLFLQGDDVVSIAPGNVMFHGHDLVADR